MALAEGGKIDTVLYSASCGALNSTATAGNGAAIRINPIKYRAEPQKAGVLPVVLDRCRLSVSPIRRHTSSQKISRKLSQRFHDANSGCMIAHGNLRHAMKSDPSLFAPFRAPYAP